MLCKKNLFNPKTHCTIIFEEELIGTESEEMNFFFLGRRKDPIWWIGHTLFNLSFFIKDGEFSPAHYKALLHFYPYLFGGERRKNTSRLSVIDSCIGNPWRGNVREIESEGPCVAMSASVCPPKVEFFLYICIYFLCSAQKLMIGSSISFVVKQEKGARKITDDPDCLQANWATNISYSLW